MTPPRTTCPRLFGLTAGARETVANQKTDVAFLHAGDPARRRCRRRDLRARRQRGAGQASSRAAVPGLHHVCFEVEDLGGALATLKAAGVRLIDETPRPGARGHLVAFLHPAATGGVLFELCEPAAPTRGPPRDRHRRQFPTALALAATLIAVWRSRRRAFAQMAPGRLRRPGRHAAAAGARCGQPKRKKAPPKRRPRKRTGPSDLEPLSGYAEQSRRRMQIFELDGYLRLRSDYMHQFFLGQGYYPSANSGVPGVTYGLPPFPVPLDCPRPDVDGVGRPAFRRTARRRTSAARTCASAWSRR